MALLKDVKSYVRNIGKSIIYAGVDSVTNKAPVFRDYVDTNQEAIQEWLDDIRGLKNGTGRVKDALDKNDFFQVGKIVFNNTLKDLKTGKWYTDDEELDAMAESMMGDIAGEFSDDDYGIGNVDDSADSLDSSPKEQQDLTGAKIISRTVMGGSQSVASSVMTGSQYISENIKASSKLSYLQSLKSIGVMNAGFGNMTSGLKNIIDFNNNIMKVHIDNSTKFYKTTTELLTKQNAMFEEFLDMQRNLYKSEQKKEKEDNSSDYSKMVSATGAFNLKGIMQNAFRNISEDLSMLDFLKDPEQAKILFAHPLQFLSEAMFSSIIGPTLNKSIEKLGKTVAGIASTTIAKANNYESDSFLGDVFKYIFRTNDVEKTTIDTSKYVRGPIQYNGMANTSIVEVIPGYLARIEAALTGGQERIFNFKTGKWTTGKRLKDEFLMDRGFSISNAMSELADSFNMQMSTINFDKEGGSKKRKSLIGDIAKVLRYISDKGGYLGDFILDKNRRVKNKGLWKTIRVSSPENLDIIAAMLDQTDSSVKMNVAAKALYARDERSRDMMEYEKNGTYSALFNGRYGGVTSVDDLEHRTSKEFAASEKALRERNNVIEVLKAIHKQVTISRYILETFDNIGRRSARRRRGSRSNTNEIKNTDWEARYANTFGKDMKSEGANTKINIDDYVYGGNFSQREDADIDIDDGNIVDKILDLGKRTRERDELERADFDSFFGYDEEAYKKYKGKNIFEKLRNADGIGEKFSVINAFIENLRNKPAKFLSNMISRVDDTIFNFFYSNESDRKDANGKPIKGFFNNMIYDAEQVFSKIGDFFKEKVVDPFKNLFTEMKQSETAKKIKQSFRNKIGYIKTGITNAFGTVFGTNKNSAQQEQGEAIPDNYSSAAIDNANNYAAIDNNNYYVTGKATGGYVPKTGLYALSRGEMVIPSTMNPYNPYSSSIAGDMAKERNVINNANKKLSIDGSYARGTYPAISSYAVNNQVAEYYDSINFLGIGNRKKTEKIEKKANDDFINKLKEDFPDIVANSTIGGIAGLFTLGPFGLFGGALLGTALIAAKRVKSVNEFLFGKENEKGEKEGGVVDDLGLRKLANAFPDMKAYGIVGATIGGASNILFGSPIGIVGGAIIGSTIGYIKHNENIQKMLFGDELKIPRKLDKYLKEHGARNMIGMGLGGAAGGLMYGPFGLAGGLMVGAGLSYLTTTDKFTDIVLGKKDKDGKRRGGIVGNLQTAIVDPLAERATDARKSFEKYLKTEIFQPLKNGIRPMFKLTSKAITGVAKTVGKFAMKMMDSDKLNILNNRILGKILKSPFGAGAATTLAIGSQFGWPVGLIAGVVTGLLGTKKGRSGLGKVVSFLPKQIEKLGNVAESFMIKRGMETDMSASERLAFMEDRTDNYKNKAYDELLANSTKGQAANLASALEIYKSNGDKSGKLMKDYDKTVRDNLRALGAGGKTSKIMKLIKDDSLTGDEFETRLYNTLIGSNFDYAQRDSIIKFAAEAKSGFTTFKNASKDFQGTKTAIEKQFANMGIDLPNSNIGNLIKQAKTEVKSREALGEENDPIKNANKNTEALLKSINTTNLINTNIFKLLSGQKFDEKDIKAMKDSIKESGLGHTAYSNLRITKAVKDQESGDIYINEEERARLNEINGTVDANIKQRDAAYTDYYSKYTNIFKGNAINTKDGMDLRSSLIRSLDKTGKDDLLGALDFAQSKGVYTMEELAFMAKNPHFKNKGDVKFYSEVIKDLASVGIKVTDVNEIGLIEDCWKPIKKLIELGTKGKVLFTDIDFEDLVSEASKGKPRSKFEKILKIAQENDYFVFTVGGLFKIFRNDYLRRALNTLKISLRNHPVNSINKPYINSLRYKFMQLMAGVIDYNQFCDAIGTSHVAGDPEIATTKTLDEAINAQQNAKNVAEQAVIAISEMTKKKVEEEVSSSSNSKGSETAISDNSNIIQFPSFEEDKSDDNKIKDPKSAYIADNLATGITMAASQFVNNIMSAGIDANKAKEDAGIKENAEEAKKEEEEETPKFTETQYGLIPLKKMQDGSYVADERSKDTKEIIQKQDEDRKTQKTIAESTETIAKAIKNGGIAGAAASSKEKNEEGKEKGGIIDSIVNFFTTGLLGKMTSGLSVLFGSLIGLFSGGIIGALKNAIKFIAKSKLGKVLFGLAGLLGIDLLENSSSASDPTNPTPGGSGSALKAGLGIAAYAGFKGVGGKIKKFFTGTKLLTMGSEAATKAGTAIGEKTGAEIATKVAAETTTDLSKGAKTAEEASKASILLNKGKDKLANTAFVKALQAKTVKSLDSIAYFLNTNAFFSKLPWLGKIFEKIKVAIVKKIASPETVFKIAKKYGLKTGFDLVKFGGPALATVATVAQIGLWFFFGWNDAESYFGVKEATFQQKVIAGICNGILGATVLGLFLDGGDILALLKPILPASLFEDVTKKANRDDILYRLNQAPKYEEKKKYTLDDIDKTDWKTAYNGGIPDAPPTKDGTPPPVPKEGESSVNGKTLGDRLADYAKQGWHNFQNRLNSKPTYTPPEQISGSGKFGRGKWGRGFYSQLDPKYAMEFNSPGDTTYQTMEDSGCGPMSAVNAASALGINVNPKDAANFALSGGYKEKDGGTTPNYFGDMLGSLGVGTENISGNNYAITNSLANGNPVILMGQDNQVSGNNPYGPGPHYVTATGIDGRGNITIQDPESRTPNKKYRASDVLSKSSIAIAAGRGKRYSHIYGREKKNLSSDIPETIWNFLKGKEVNEVVIAAIMGNIYAESGYNPGAVNPTSGAFGLCQWTNERATALANLAAKRGVAQTDVAVQLEHLWNELNGSHNAAYTATIEAAESQGLDAAVDTFCRQFEAPSDAEIASSMSKRINAARDAYKKKGKGIVVDGSYDTDATIGSFGSSGSSSGGLFGALDSLASMLDVSSMFGFGKHHYRSKWGRGEVTNPNPYPVPQEGASSINGKTFGDKVYDTLSGIFGGLKDRMGNDVTYNGNEKYSKMAEETAKKQEEERKKAEEEAAEANENGELMESGRTGNAASTVDDPNSAKKVNPATTSKAKTQSFPELNNIIKLASSFKNATAGVISSFSTGLASTAFKIFGPIMTKLFGGNIFSKTARNIGGMIFGDSSSGAPDPEGIPRSEARPAMDVQDADNAQDFLLKNLPGASITSRYNEPRGNYNHGGVDIGVPVGTPIPSPTSGKVYEIGIQKNGYGLYVQTVDKNGKYHIFPHLSSVPENIHGGMEIKRGDVIAISGGDPDNPYSGHSTGPHLHYEIDPYENRSASSDGDHEDPSSYSLAGLGKIKRKIASNNKAASKLSNYSKRRMYAKYPNSELPSVQYGKGTGVGDSDMQLSKPVDYSQKFDAIIGLLTSILAALGSSVSNGNGEGTSATALTPTVAFSGGASNLGESFSRADIVDIINSMNSIASKK